MTTHLEIHNTRLEMFRSRPKDSALYHYDVTLVFDSKVRIGTVPKTGFMSAVDARAEIDAHSATPCVVIVAHVDESSSAILSGVPQDLRFALLAAMWACMFSNDHIQ
jgi:hypothetical protein